MTDKASDEPTIEESPATGCDQCDCSDCPGPDADPLLLAEHSKACGEKHF